MNYDQILQVVCWTLLVVFSLASVIDFGFFKVVRYLLIGYGIWCFIEILKGRIPFGGL